MVAVPGQFLIRDGHLALLHQHVLLGGDGKRRTRAFALGDKLRVVLVLFGDLAAVTVDRMAGGGLQFFADDAWFIAPAAGGPHGAAVDRHAAIRVVVGPDAVFRTCSVHGTAVDDHLFRPGVDAVGATGGVGVDDAAVDGDIQPGAKVTLFWVFATGLVSALGGNLAAVDRQRARWQANGVIPGFTGDDFQPAHCGLILALGVNGEIAAIAITQYGGGAIGAERFHFQGFFIAKDQVGSAIAADLDVVCGGYVVLDHIPLVSLEGEGIASDEGIVLTGLSVYNFFLVLIPYLIGHGVDDELRLAVTVIDNLVDRAGAGFELGLCSRIIGEFAAVGEHAGLVAFHGDLLLTCVFAGLDLRGNGFAVAEGIQLHLAGEHGRSPEGEAVLGIALDGDRVLFAAVDDGSTTDGQGEIALLAVGVDGLPFVIPGDGTTAGDGRRGVGEQGNRAVHAGIAGNLAAGH